MSPFLYKQLNGFLAQYDFYMNRQEGQELLTLRINVFTSTIQAVGQPTRYIIVFMCRNIKDYAYMNSKSGASSHNVKAPQNMLDGMADKGVFAILLQEASKWLQLNNCF